MEMLFIEPLARRIYSSETIEDKRRGLHGILFRVGLVILVLDIFIRLRETLKAPVKIYCGWQARNLNSIKISTPGGYTA